MKLKNELKWTLGLLLLFFPLLALVLLKQPAPDGELIQASSTQDTLLLNSPLYSEVDPENIQDHFGSTQIHTQYVQDYFQLPVDYDPYLSGTFGELRSNHFHSGIDIRTGGVEGKPIYASADGYISRINVSEKGYGKALYINHPNGFTTVYAHLKAFNKDIAFYTEKYQYNRKKFEVELYPEKELISVKKGEIIAYSGNTGGSAGPHLHFEIRKTATQEPLNPLQFGLKIKDELAPDILEVFLYRINPQFRTESGSYEYLKLNTNPKVLPGRKLQINLPPGSYATGAFIKDYFRQKTENLGINQAQLSLNNEVIFSFNIDKINFKTTRLINTHMDFCAHKIHNIKAHRMFLDQGNMLHFYTVNKDNGVVTIHHQDTLPMQIKVQDLAGFSDSVKVILLGDTATKPAFTHPKYVQSDECKQFKVGTSFYYGNRDMRLTVPSRALYFNYTICFNKSKKNILNAVSEIWKIGEVHVPIHDYCDLAIRVNPEIESQYHDKLLIVEYYDNKSYPIGGKNKNGFIECKIRDLGAYYLAIDTIAPTITPKVVGQNNQFKFHIQDNLSGINSYNAYINNQWILMEYEPKTGMILGKLKESLGTGKHIFKLIVSDKRNNTQTFTKEIIIP